VVSRDVSVVCCCADTNDIQVRLRSVTEHINFGIPYTRMPVIATECSVVSKGINRF
jgi:hypothetical protein